MPSKGKSSHIKDTSNHLMMSLERQKDTLTKSKFSLRREKAKSKNLDKNCKGRAKEERKYLPFGNKIRV